MQLNKIILLLMFSLVVSCHGVSQESKNSDAGDTNSQTINFFDKQYNTSYQLVIDTSTIADHPFYSYLDCDKEGYFTIHFVPKSKELRDFWSNQFYKGVRLDTHNFDNDTIKIRTTIQSNQAAYNIFLLLCQCKYLIIPTVNLQPETYTLYRFRYQTLNTVKLRTLV